MAEMEKPKQHEIRRLDNRPITFDKFFLCNLLGRLLWQVTVFIGFPVWWYQPLDSTWPFKPWEVTKVQLLCVNSREVSHHHTWYVHSLTTVFTVIKDRAQPRRHRDWAQGLKWYISYTASVNRLQNYGKGRSRWFFRYSETVKVGWKRLLFISGRWLEQLNGLFGELLASLCILHLSLYKLYLSLLFHISTGCLHSISPLSPPSSDIFWTILWVCIDWKCEEFLRFGTRIAYLQKLCCLASVDGKECKEVFDTYDDFEEHYCQKHLDLTLFACGGKGCTAQFGTILQIFRHLEICKRRGKKVSQNETFRFIIFFLYKIAKINEIFFSQVVALKKISKQWYDKHQPGKIRNMLCFSVFFLVFGFHELIMFFLFQSAPWINSSCLISYANIEFSDETVAKFQ